MSRAIGGWSTAVILGTLLGFGGVVGPAAAPAAAQVAPGPPRPGPPAVDRPMSRKELEQKGKRRASQPGGAQPGAPAGGAAGAGGAGGAAEPDPAEKRAGVELLQAMKRSASALRRDALEGSLTLLGEAGRRDRIALEVWRRFDADGGAAVLIRHGRRADLPPAAILLRVDAAGLHRWHRFEPESRKVREVPAGPETRIEGSALRIDDFLPPVLDPETAVFAGHSILDARRTSVFLVDSRGGSARLRVHVRQDVRSVARIEWPAAADEPVRTLRFDDFRITGVHRRWTGLYATEPGGPPSAVVTVANWSLNDADGAPGFEPADLPRLF